MNVVLQPAPHTLAAPPTTAPQYNWVELPQGQDISIRKGYSYAALVSVRNNISSDTLKSKAAEAGITIEQWREQGQPGVSLKDPDSTHRYIHMIVLATQDAGMLPWSKSILLYGELFHVVKAWYSAPAGAPGGSKAPAPQATPTNWLAWGAALAATTGVGWWWFYRRKKRR